MDKLQLGQVDDGRLDIAVAVELSMGRLYRRLAGNFPEHADVWWRISMEEMNHASLLRAAKDLIPFGVNAQDFPLGAERDLRDLQQKIETADSEIEAGELDQPGAYERALALEYAVGEQGLQPQAYLDQSNPLGRILRRLHSETDDHSAIIRGLLEKLPPQPGA
jgi:hypothetical protein